MDCRLMSRPAIPTKQKINIHCIYTGASKQIVSNQTYRSWPSSPGWPRCPLNPHLLPAGIASPRPSATNIEVSLSPPISNTVCQNTTSLLLGSHLSYNTMHSILLKTRVTLNIERKAYVSQILSRLRLPKLNLYRSSSRPRMKVDAL